MPASTVGAGGVWRPVASYQDSFSIPEVLMPSTHSKRGCGAPPFHAGPFCCVVDDPDFCPCAVKSDDDDDDDDDDPKMDESLSLSLDDLSESSNRLLPLFFPMLLSFALFFLPLLLFAFEGLCCTRAALQNSPPKPIAKGGGIGCALSPRPRNSFSTDFMSLWVQMGA